MQRIVELIISTWKKNSAIEFKEDEKKAVASAMKAIEGDFIRESQLDAEVYRMLDDLEKQHGGQFQRNKMFHLLKKKLAGERKIIL